MNIVKTFTSLRATMTQANGKRKRSRMRSEETGLQPKNTKKSSANLTQDDVARMQDSELLELGEMILDEIKERIMQNAG